MILKNLTKKFYLNLFSIILIFALDRISKMYVIYLNEKASASELCITSKAEIFYKENSEISVETNKAKGSKCPVCWKISEDSCIRHSQ